MIYRGEAISIKLIVLSATSLLLLPRVAQLNGQEAWERGQIVDRNSRKCLGVSGAAMERGTILVQWECNGSPDQKWEMRRTGEIVNRNSHLCMGVDGGSRERGAHVVQWECNGHEDQRWSVQLE